ncbi:MAG TPA: hypothetical protein VFO39_22335 [Candidatus Sulfotelmatobacter sp.]|nr:hypothetical protein [Candidatus Sulfotelmatobacter sp.]
MKKLIPLATIALCSVIGLQFTSVTASAQSGTPSSKATAAYNSAVGCSITATSGTWSCADVFSGAAKSITPDNYVEIMGSAMKVSNSQSMFVSTSLVTGLYTNTLVTTKPSKTTGGTNTSTATATGGVYLRAVLLDAPNGNVIAYGYPAAACNTAVLGCSGTGPDSGVILDSRVQTLSQSLSDCVVNVTVSGLAGTGTCDFTSTIQLILQTTSAHSYNFIFPNVGVGTWYMSIQATADSAAVVNTGTGSAVGGAAYGLGSMTIESVRLVHSFSF